MAEQLTGTGTGKNPPAKGHLLDNAKSLHLLASRDVCCITNFTLARRPTNFVYLPSGADGRQFQ